MRQDRSLRHSRWECKYHVVFIPKYRKKAIFGQIRKELGDVMKRLAEQKRNFVGEHFWTRGYFVSTVGRDEEVIREYIRHQEQEDRRVDQLNLM